MDKNKTYLIIVGAVFFFSLILYAITSSVITVILHILLLTTGSFMCSLLISKNNKSINSLKLKIYFNFISSFLIFLIISFFWFLGDHSSIDDKGLVTMFIIFPSSIIFFIIFFAAGTIIACKRKNIGKFTYNSKVRAKIFTALSVFLLLIPFYNPLISFISKSSDNPDLCRKIISAPSYMFSPYFEGKCLLDVAIKLGDENICSQIDKKEITACYFNVAVTRKDASLCFKRDDLNSSACIRYIMERTGRDPKICESITETKEKDFCISAFYDLNEKYFR